MSLHNCNTFRNITLTNSNKFIHIVTRRHNIAKRSFFCDTTFCLKTLTTYEPLRMVIGHAQLSLKCRLPNRISFDVFYPWMCKVETRACETLRSCDKRLGGLAVTTSPGASRWFNPALLVINNLFYFTRTFRQLCAVLFVHLS